MRYKPDPDGASGRVVNCEYNVYDGIYANLVILATPLRVIGHQVVHLGHLGGMVAF